MNKKAEYDIKYEKENTRQIKFKFNKKYDKDILDQLDKQPNKQGYIKDLIRKDIEDASK